jgi:hypothetical protein
MRRFMAAVMAFYQRLDLNPFQSRTTRGGDSCADVFLSENFAELEFEWAASVGQRESVVARILDGRGGGVVLEKRWALAALDMGVREIERGANGLDPKTTMLGPVCKAARADGIWPGNAWRVVGFIAVAAYSISLLLLKPLLALLAVAAFLLTKRWHRAAARSQCSQKK